MAVPVGNEKRREAGENGGSGFTSAPMSRPKSLFEGVPSGHQIDTSTPESRFIAQLMSNLANPVFLEGTSDEVRRIHEAHKPKIDVGQVPNNSDPKGRVIRRGDPDYYVRFGSAALEAAYPLTRTPPPKKKLHAVRPHLVRAPDPATQLPAAKAA